MTRVNLRLLVSMLISNIGEWVYFIALNLTVLTLTNSPAAVSILYLLIPVAALATNSWAGSVVDRVNVRKLLIALDGIRAILVLILVFTTNLLMMYSLSFLIHICVAISSPASLVYMTTCVDKKEQQQFNAWKNLVQSSGFILGPSITGALFLVGTPQFAILINSVALMISVAILFTLPDVEREHSQDQGQRRGITMDTLKHDWSIVVQFAKGAVIVSVVYSLYQLFVVILTAIDSLEAAFAITTLRLRESSYGLLVSAAGVGFIAGSIFNIRWRVKLAASISYGALGTMVGYFIYSLSHSWWMAACGFFILSFANVFVNIGILTYIQRLIPITILGRFTSVFSLINASGTILFVLLFGLLSNMMTLRSIVLIGVLLLLTLAVALFVILHKERNDQVIDR